MLTREGHDPAMLWRDPDYWHGLGETLDIWIAHTARSLAIAITSVCSVIDFEAVIVDGGFPADVCDRVVAATRAAILPAGFAGNRKPAYRTGAGRQCRTRHRGGKSAAVFTLSA